MDNLGSKTIYLMTITTYPAACFESPDVHPIIEKWYTINSLIYSTRL